MADLVLPVEVTARRIVWGKFLTAGQTCIAPDYLLVHEDVKPALVEALVSTIQTSYGEAPAASPDFSRIVNEHQFERLAELLGIGDVVVRWRRRQRHGRLPRSTYL